MKRAYKKTAKKILERAEKELDSPEKNAPLDDWIAFALRKYDETNEKESMQQAVDRQLLDIIVTELFFTFDEVSLNRLINALSALPEKKDRVHCDYPLSSSQAAVLAEMVSQRFSSQQKEYLLHTLITTRDTKKPPIRIYKRSSRTTCPVCTSTQFKPVLKDFLAAGVLSHRVCQACGYQHKVMAPS